jgi:hypothetical protein
MVAEMCVCVCVGGGLIGATIGDDGGLGGGSAGVDES